MRAVPDPRRGGTGSFRFADAPQAGTLPDFLVHVRGALRSRRWLAICGLVVAVSGPVIAGHPWLTARTNRGGTYPVRAADLASNGPASFDIVVGLDSRPDNTERQKWERVFSHCSEAIFEATEGVHFVRKVRIFPGYSEDWKELPVDISVQAAGHPAAMFNGLWRSMDRIYMFERFGDKEFLATPKGEKQAGHVLAHEWGHYAYGLGDEYYREDNSNEGWVVAKDEKAVAVSIMSDVWSATKAPFNNVDPLYHLNFSIAHSPLIDRTSVVATGLETTEPNMQYGLHRASCWETLERPVTAEERQLLCSSYEPRRSFGELRQAALAPGRIPSLQKDKLPPAPNVIWMEKQRVVIAVLDRSGSMGTTGLAKARGALRVLVDTLEDSRDWFGIVAFDSEATVVQEPRLMASSADREAVRRAIDGITLGGGTSIKAGVEQAVTLLRQPTHQSKLRGIFLITDGRDEAVMDAAPSARIEGVPVFSLAYGDESGADGLQRLSTVTGGEFRTAPKLAGRVMRFFRELAVGGSEDRIGDGFVDLFAGAEAPMIVEPGAQRLVIEASFSQSPEDVEVSIAGPDGTILAPVEPLADLEGESAARFVVANPSAGAWRLIIGNRRPSERIQAEYSARQSHPGFAVQLSALPIEDPAARPARLRLRLDGAFLLTGAVVQGIVSAPSGTTTALTFQDDGKGADAGAADGIYCAFFSQSESGQHTIRAKADNRHGTLASTSILTLVPPPDGPPPPKQPPQRVDRSFERSALCSSDLLAPGRAPAMTVLPPAAQDGPQSGRFEIQDPDTPIRLLKVVARSLSPELIPQDMLSLGTDGLVSQWILNAAPVTRTMGGVAAVEVEVSDGYASAKHTFQWNLAADSGSQNIEDGTPNGEEEEMRWLLNRMRFDPPAENTRLGSAYAVPAGPLAPLSANSKIGTAARRHSQDMGATGTFDHLSPAGSSWYLAGASPGDRMTAEGYLANGWAENIAAGYGSARAAHEGLFRSAGHRENMLTEFLRESGFGYAAVAGSPYVRYYTQTFGNHADQAGRFTGTFLRDANGDGAYQSGEGVGGVQVWLRRGRAFFRHYDISGTAGNFAVPLDSLPPGRWEIVVRSSGAGLIDLPQPGRSSLRRIALSQTEWSSLGWIDGEARASNRGLESLTLDDAEEVPGFAAASQAPFGVWSVERLQEGSWRLAFPTRLGVIYQVQTSEDLSDWIDIDFAREGTGGFVTIQIARPSRNGASFFRIVER